MLSPEEMKEIKAHKRQRRRMATEAMKYISPPSRKKKRICGHCIMRSGVRCLYHSGAVVRHKKKACEYFQE